MNSIGKKEDKRVVYTKLFLREALLELMREKPIEKITVTELCKKAEINRNTFYTHYLSPSDVLTEIEDDFISYVSASIENSDLSFNNYIYDICNMIWDKRDICKVLLSNESGEEFWKRIVSSCREKVFSGWRELGMNISDERMEMIFCFMVFGGLSLINYWIKNDIDLTPNEVAKTIGTLADNGVKAFFDN